MKKLLIIVGMILLTGVLIAQASAGISPTYTLIDNEGLEIAYIWEIGSDKFYTGDVVHFCGCDLCVEVFSTEIFSEKTKTPLAPINTPPANPTPINTIIPVPPTATSIHKVFCHCEQGEGEGAQGRKNCHPVKYTPGHANHEWDYWDYTKPYCDGWNH